MIEFNGDIFAAHVDWTVFTANSCLTRDGRLVMGAGVAKSVRDAVPGIDAVFGTHVRAACGHKGTFFLLIDYNFCIIALQTKIDWKNPSPRDLVFESCRQLGEFARSRPNERFAVTRPGCGQGGLDWFSVGQILGLMWPDNVIVCHKEDPC